MINTSENLIKRYLILLAGLSIMAFGVAFSIKADLGTSPISSVPYAISTFTPFSVGRATIGMHCIFILLFSYSFHFIPSSWPFSLLAKAAGIKKSPLRPEGREEASC